MLFGQEPVVPQWKVFWDVARELPFQAAFIFITYQVFRPAGWIKQWLAYRERQDESTRAWQSTKDEKDRDIRHAQGNLIQRIIGDQYVALDKLITALRAERDEDRKAAEARNEKLIAALNSFCRARCEDGK